MTEKKQDNSLASAISLIEKQFGKGSILQLKEGQSLYKDLPVISTRSLSLDLALGVGGFPRGRMIEIFGPESSGKTTLALQVIAEAQSKGGAVAFIDAEHALDIEYAQKLGVRTDDLLISQPDYGEQALEIADKLIASGAIDVIAIDSVAALVPRAELDGEMGSSHVGLHARLMSQAMRKISASVSKTGTCLIFINQIRSKIGVTFGSPNVVTGGNALKFYATIRIDIRRIGAVKNGNEVTGNRTLVKVVKNKVAPPYRNAEFEIIYGKGIDRSREIVDLAAQHKIINKSGSWYSYGDTRLGQGRDNVKEFLLQNADLSNEIEKLVREEYV